MMESDYIEPGVYRDALGTEVNVTQRPDGRYEVEYGDGLRSAFSAATIRKCYPIVVALVAVAALAFAGIASAATTKQVREARKVFTHQLKPQLANYFGDTKLSQVRIVCHSTGSTSAYCLATSRVGRPGLPGNASAGEGFTFAGSMTSDGLTSPASPMNARIVHAGGANLATPENREARITLGQREALQDARSYLQMGGFSLKSLISQVEYDGFSAANATYGATHAGANWNQQAVDDARSYMQMGGFSASGLISQLEFDGFTTSQAKFGAKAVGY